VKHEANNPDKWMVGVDGFLFGGVACFFVHACGSRRTGIPPRALGRRYYPLRLITVRDLSWFGKIGYGYKGDFN